MPKVKIMFSGNVNEIGKIRSVSREEAASMVREGRAKLVNDPPPAATPVPGDPIPAAQPDRGQMPKPAKP